MADTSTCYSLACGETVEGTVEKCPKCGGKTRTSKTVRRLGWLLLLIGLFLVGFMGMITWKLLPSLMPVGDTLGTDTFTGTEEQAQMVLGLFGLVIAFGFASIFNGTWQIATGRRNRLVTFLTLGLAALLFGAAWFTRQALRG